MDIRPDVLLRLFEDQYMDGSQEEDAEFKDVSKEQLKAVLFQMWKRGDVKVWRRGGRVFMEISKEGMARMFARDGVPR